jgi:asparagine synthetase B (glutamine-hydrolysing)
LLNVSFDGQLAPDRISALAGLKELQRISPIRRWRLVEIDTVLTNLKGESEHVMSLIYPSNTYMDLNIGIALWLAAGGDGWVDGSICNMQDGCRYKYKSTSRVLLVGSGADEQCAGYGRHRTKYRLGGYVRKHQFVCSILAYQVVQCIPHEMFLHCNCKNVEFFFASI